MSIPSEWGPIEDGQTITMPLVSEGRTPRLYLPDSRDNEGQRSHVLDAVSDPGCERALNRLIRGIPDAVSGSLDWVTADKLFYTAKLDYQHIIQYPFLLTYNTEHTHEPIANIAMSADGEILNKGDASIIMRFRFAGQRFMARGEYGRREMCRTLGISAWTWHHTHWAVHEGDLHHLLGEMSPDFVRTYNF